MITSLSKTGEINMELLKNATRIRKRWLLCFKVRVWSISLLLAAVPLIGLFLNPPDALNAFFLVAFVFLIYGSCSWMEYKCAYKSPGTKLLVFLMIGAIYSIVNQIIILINGGDILPALLLIPLFIWDIITSYNLRELNKATKKQEKDEQSSS